MSVPKSEPADLATRAAMRANAACARLDRLRNAWLALKAETFGACPGCGAALDDDLGLADVTIDHEPGCNVAEINDALDYDSLLGGAQGNDHG